MTKWHRWEETRAQAAPDTIRRALNEADVLTAAIELCHLRKARNLTQEELAERLGTGQPSISKLERRADMRVSSLREVVEAMGGELRITAHFPDAEYPIDCCAAANGRGAARE